METEQLRDSMSQNLALKS